MHPIYRVPGQKGVALVMALVFLLLLTIMGLTAMSTTSLEEKMAGNVKDKNLSFQAAESALLVGESWLSSLLGWPGINNSIGLYQFDSTSGDPVWDTVDWTGTADLVVYPNTPGTTVGGGLNGVSTQPKYIVEYVTQVREQGGSIGITAPTNWVFRTTAYGTGGTNAAVTMLQTTYSRPF